MQSKRVGDMILLKIDRGEEVMQKLVEVLDSNRISCGTVRWGIGMVSNADIGYLDNGKYLRKKYPDRMEVVAFHGSISSNDPRLHIHASLSDRNHMTSGGHVFSAIADPMMEVEVSILPDGTITRSLNTESGLNEFNLA